jgi:hypothetical protein
MTKTLRNKKHKEIDKKKDYIGYLEHKSKKLGIPKPEKD